MVPRRGHPRGDRRDLADRGLHGHPRRRVRRVRVRAAEGLAARVPRDGQDLRAAALHERPLHQQGHRRDPRAAGLHGRLPDDDGGRHLHHQRHGARRRDAARALAGRLHHGAEGPRQAGLHGEPDARARLLARARDRQEGPGLRAHRPQAQAAGHDAHPRAARRGPDDGRAPAPPRHGRGARHDHGRRHPRALHGSRDRSLEPLHRLHARQGPGQDPRPGPRRGLQEAAPRRAADARELARPPARPVLRLEALRPHAGRPLQAQHAARPRGRPGGARAHGARPRRADPAPRQPAAQAGPRSHGRRVRRGAGLLRGAQRADAHGRRPPRARRVRALRQPAPAHGRRARAGGVPPRPLPHGARRPRADDDRGRRHDHAADDHQHPPGRRGAQGVLRLLAAVAVHGSDELAVRPHPPPPPLGARLGRPDPRARADRGARRPLHALRPHVPDRDARGSEHRPHRLALLVREGLGARLRPGAVPARRERLPERRGALPRRVGGGALADRPGERADRGGRLARLARPRAQDRRRARPGRRHRGPLHGRGAGADRLRRDGADPVPRARRREPRPHGLEHACARPCRS